MSDNPIRDVSREAEALRWAGRGLVLPVGDRVPSFGDEVFLADGAVVMGDVALGDQVSVWYNTVVRGDVHRIRIGARTNVQDLCTCHVTGGTHPLVVGEDVTVGHRAVLHGCTIGDRVLVGMGSIVLDGAVIGDDVLVGAGAVVTPGAQIPPGVLVLGSPARVRRPLSAEELASLRRSAAHYVGNAAVHARIPGALRGASTGANRT